MLLVGAALADEEHAAGVQRAPRRAGTAERPRGGTLHPGASASCEIRNGLGPAVDATAAFAQLHGRLAGRATPGVWIRASSPARTAVTLLTGDRLAYRRRDLHDQRDGRRLRRHPAAPPKIRLRSATRVDQGPLSGYDPRHLDMLTPDRPRRCRAQLACTVCAELQEAARSAVGSHAPVETPSRSSGVHAAATRRRPAGSAVSRTGHPAQARRCGKRVAGYPVGDGGSGAGVLSTRR